MDAFAFYFDEVDNGVLRFGTFPLSNGLPSMSLLFVYSIGFDLACA